MEADSAIKHEFHDGEIYADGGVACDPSQLSDKDGMSLENPTLLFEVLSPSTRDYDRGAKLFLYQQIPSLSDVLLIDQPARRVERHHRGPRGWTTETYGEGTIAIFEGHLSIDDLYRLPPGLPDD